MDYKKIVYLKATFQVVFPAHEIRQMMVGTLMMQEIYVQWIQKGGWQMWKVDQ